MELSQVYEEILMAADETFPPSSHRLIAMEEAAELIQALTHYERGRVGADKVAEEVGDVIIMCRQLIINFGMEEAVAASIDKKMFRLTQRIAHYDQEYKGDPA